MFDHERWVIGGHQNDDWSSREGKHLTQKTLAGAFSARHDHQVVVLKNKLWLSGGWDGDNQNDVWSSDGGITWIQETANAAFPAPNVPQVEVFASKLWLIGGDDGSTENRVWSSTDGVTWRQGFHSTINFP